MNITKTLKEIKNNDKTSIKSYVAEEILDSIDYYNETPKEQVKAWYNDLMTNGCAGGMIDGLIYYTDTHKFYNDYADEIEELLDEYADNVGEEIKPQGDRRNFYAWFGFEATARKIVEEDLCIEY